MRQRKVSWWVNQSPKHAILSALLLAAGSPLAWTGDTAAVKARPFLQGAWQEPNSGEMLYFDGERVIGNTGETLSIRGVVRREPGTLVTRHLGLLETWGVALDNGTLRITIDGSQREFKALDSVPPAVQLQPVPIGEPKKLGDERLSAIRSALAERAAKGQAVRQDRERWPEMKTVDAENTRYLKELVKEVGWIDVSRFGARAATDAFLLVQHSGDVPLMMAAMPYLEKDFKHSDGAQSYALLYDRLQLSLGRKQLYGTQIGMDKQGNPLVFPLEDPEKIDELLRELKLPPLKEYLSEAARVLFNGKEIRVPGPSE